MTMKRDSRGRLAEWQPIETAPKDETVISALIDQLEAASCGSMGLSREVARAVGWVNRGNSKRGEWAHPDDVRDGKVVLDSLHGTDLHREPPDFTRSLDAARTLMPENYFWTVDSSGCAGMRRLGEDFWTHADGKTPALALCIAALTVRAANHSSQAGDQ